MWTLSQPFSRSSNRAERVARGVTETSSPAARPQTSANETATQGLGVMVAESKIRGGAM